MLDTCRTRRRLTCGYRAGRQVATGLDTTDFTSYANAFGADAYAVRHAGELRTALTKALVNERPALVWVNAEPEQISVYQEEETTHAR